METMATAVSQPTNDGAKAIADGAPYMAQIEITGNADLLFHRWSVEDVEIKGKAAKGSKTKKEDNVESYVYRTQSGNLALPGEYIRMSIVNAAKYKQDPRSPRKSAMDLFKAGVVTLDQLCDLGVKDWDYLDRRRVTVQRNGITRTRPALLAGWKCMTTLQVLTPEYIAPALLNETVQLAGKLIGVADNRPTYGRFLVSRFEVVGI
jgi:hypothetical protein